MHLPKKPPALPGASRISKASTGSGAAAWRTLAFAATRAPKILDLLAATPALSASLASRHLGCSPQASGGMLRDLTALGIVTEATSRSRWKIYLAGDLASPDPGDSEEPQPLSFSDPALEIDREAIDATLDTLFRDLERLEKRTRAALAGN